MATKVYELGKEKQCQCQQKNKYPWYIPVTEYEGIQVITFNETICPHFSSFQDAQEARVLIGYARSGYHTHKKI